MSKENRAELYGKMLAGEIPGISVYPTAELNTDVSRCSNIVEKLQAFDSNRSGCEEIAKGSLSSDLGKYQQINVELRREDNLKRSQTPVMQKNGMEL